MSDPCPCCDVTDGVTGPVDALALGVALGSAFGQEKTREMMCTKHRTRYVMAMLQGAVKMRVLDKSTEKTGERP